MRAEDDWDTGGRSGSARGSSARSKRRVRFAAARRASAGGREGRCGGTRAAARVLHERSTRVPREKRFRATIRAVSTRFTIYGLYVLKCTLIYCSLRHTECCRFPYTIRD